MTSGEESSVNRHARACSVRLALPWSCDYARSSRKENASLIGIIQTGRFFMTVSMVQGLCFQLYQSSTQPKLIVLSLVSERTTSEGGHSIHVVGADTVGIESIHIARSHWWIRTLFSVEPQRLVIYGLVELRRTTRISVRSGFIE